MAVRGQIAQQPQGVDLNLSKFNLSAATRMTGSMAACSTDANSLEARVSVGSVFVDNLGKDFGGCFNDKHTELLQRVFNPYICDRQTEGKLFLPPDTRIEYVTRLEGLVKGEVSCHQRRLQAFTSKDF